MRNIAKINLTIEHCTDCPLCRASKDGKGFSCRHDNVDTFGMNVGDGENIPDNCPYVIKRLQDVYDFMKNSKSIHVPNKYIARIESRQESVPNGKFGSDHGVKHIERVTKIGLNFMDSCLHYGYITKEELEKQKLLFKIAVYLHDIGLAEQSSSHDSRSVVMAKKFLLGEKADLDPEDVEIITHAIFNHTTGQDTKTIVDAALVLADKLDITEERIIRILDDVTRIQYKILATEFKIYGKSGKAEGAELRYTVKDDFDAMMLRQWPKCVIIPRMIALDYLNLSWFKFFVNNQEVNVMKIIC